MSFQQGAFQTDAFQLGLGDQSAQPQRLYLWRPLALLALGLFAVEDQQTVNQNTLHAFRGSSAHGLRPAFYNQLVLVEGEAEARRTDHNQRLFFGRSSTVVTGGAPWYLWKRPAQQVEQEEETKRKPVDLTPYRSSFANGVPTYFYVPPRPFDAEEDPRRTDQNQLLTRFRSAPQTVTVGAPWYLWAPQIKRIEPEEDARRGNHNLLHLYRQAFQTVGQSWAYWIKPQKRVEAEEYNVPGPASLYPYRQITIQVLPGQPWFMWPAAIADQTIEPNPVVTDHAAALYPFRPHDAIVPPEPTPDVTGGWPIPRRKRVPRETEQALTIQEISQGVSKAQERLTQRKELRRQELKAAQVTAQIRTLLDEQDFLKLSLDELRTRLEQARLSDEDIAIILALAS